MRRSRFRKYAIPVIVLMVLAAVGAASTNAIIDTSPATNDANVGYAAVTINSSITLDNIAYATDSTGQEVTGVTLTFDSALLSTDEVRVTFNGDGTPNSGTTETCTTTNETVYTCAGWTQTAKTLSDVDIAVTPVTT
jgi:hypothetical protein